ncbi:MAG TPA: hypothetical protein VGA61_08640 [Anaerolineae bacterium]
MQRTSRFARKAASALFLVMLGLGGWANPGLPAAAQAIPEAASAVTPAPASQTVARLVGAQALPPIQGYEYNGDVRDLPAVPSTTSYRPRLMRQRPSATAAPAAPLAPPAPAAADAPVAPNMPAPSASFEGLAFNTTCNGPVGPSCGNGYPPDPVGDVGPHHYIAAVNTAVGIYDKTNGNQIAAYTFNSLWGTAHSGTACDGNNRGDPTVLYDALADRWIVADFGFVSETAPPYYECIAVSKTGDPVAGGWWLFPLRADDATHPWLNDYPKMAVWHDEIYLTANEFVNSASGFNFAGVRLWAINRSQIEAGILNFQMMDVGANVFTLLPANLHGALPPAGSPAFLAAENFNSPNAFSYEVYTLRVDWRNPNLTTLTGPIHVAQTAYAAPWTGSGSTMNTNIIPQPNVTTPLDSIDDRFMMQLQYRNLNGTESLWLAHTVRPTGATSGPTAIQWAQLDVTGGTIKTTPVQEQIFTNGSDGLYRWIPGIAVDTNGNAAVGYSVSSSTTYPSIRWAGRYAWDAPNTLGRGEGSLMAGGASQNLQCPAGTPCSRWGDYSAMTVDPVDNCTFWYVNEYYAAGDTANWHTRIGSFKFPSCVKLMPVAYLPLLTR